MEKIRLDRWLANMGVGSRNEVKEYIRRGLVRVNGTVTMEPKRRLEMTDEVQVEEQVIAYRRYTYYLMNKPPGVLSATRDRRATVLDLLLPSDRRTKVFPVGRLDRDTTGLLLLTDDGKLAHALLSPKSHIEKVYEATVDRPLQPEDIKAFQAGFFLQPEGIHTRPAQLEICEPYRARVRIVEGKYHQVKRMFAFCGKEVQTLRRLQMGPLRLDPEVEEGRYRPLREEEIEALRHAAARGRETV